MRELVQEYLQSGLNRRVFVKRMVQSGFSLMAANAVLAALPPTLRPTGEPKDEAGIQPFTRKFRGTGGEILAEQLIEAGVEYVFVGNSTGIAALGDAMVDRPKLKPILTVHEGHCPAMADGYSRASGKIAFGMFSMAGVSNASGNLFNAMKDRSGMVMSTDHTPVLAAGRDGREDLEAPLEPIKEITKWRWKVESSARISEWVMKAFKLSSTPPGGPTFLMFPGDVLNAQDVEADIFLRGTFDIPMTVRADVATIEKMARTLIEAKSPLLRAGPEVWRFNAVREIVELAELLAIPVTSGSERNGYRLTCNFPTNHPLFLEGFAERMRYPRSIDVLLNMGEKLPDPESGPRKIADTVKIIDVRIEASDIGQDYPVYMGVAANVKLVAEDLIQAIKSMATADRLKQIRGDRLEQTRQYVARLRQARQQAMKANWDKVPMAWERLSSEINDAAERDAYIVEEFGSEAPKATRCFTFAEGEKTLIGRTTGFALGWGVPASAGVKIAQPDKQVISLQGDGGFLFGGQAQSLWTMSRYQIPVITVIYNNRSYNEPRERAFSLAGRQAQTNKDMFCYLGDPDVDFVKLAAAFGVPGEQVVTPDQIKPAMQRAARAAREGKPYLIDALVGRTGKGADSTWYPKLSVAEMRTKKV